MFFPTNFDPTRLPRIFLATVILIIPSISLKAKDWKRHEIFTGAHVNSATAADYDGDGDLDLYVCHYSKGDLEFEAGATVIGSGGQFVYHDANNGGRNYLYRNDGGTEKLACARC